MKVSNWLGLLGVAAAGTFLVGCAQDVGDIDRTQPNKVEKALFENDDEWYYRQTIVDTDQVANGGGSGIFEAYEGSLHRIRWTITEDVLYAYSTVEPAEGVYDGQVDPESARYGVVAAFPIQGHFDVERSYNPSTGEPSNVIVENGSDRHWYERKYMRVDWSTNLTNGLWDPGGYAGTFASTSRVVPTEDGHVDADRTRISDDYIDTVTEYYYEPDIYACFTTLGFDSIYNCEGGPLSVRNSFLKRGEETYVPLEYTDNVYIHKDDESVDKLYTMGIYDPNLQQVFTVECNEYAKNFEKQEFGASMDDACSPETFDMFGRFGYFRTERVAWDDGRGANQVEQRRYYANRWNIWETMLAEDGSVLPMDQRTPKPIVYYLNPEYPRDMIAGAEEVAAQWNKAFTETVAIAKYGDKSQASIDKVVTELKEAGHSAGAMYEIRHNNCSADGLKEWVDANGTAQDADRMDVDEILGEFQARWGSDLVEAVWESTHDARVQLCADLEYATETREEGGFTWQRVGDLRYSFFNWVDEEVPWLGYGPSAADPITGQIISGNANFAGAAIRTYGPYAADLVQYMNGELEEEDLIRGDHIREYLLEQKETRNQPLSTEGKREMARRAGLNPAAVSPSEFAERPDVHELPLEILKHGHKAAQRDALRNVIANENARSTDTRMVEFYDQPSVRQFMMQDPNFALMVEGNAAREFGPDFNREDVNQAFLTTTNPLMNFDRYQRRSDMLMQRNMCFQEDQVERALQSLVTYAGVNDAFKGKSAEEISKHFVHSMFVGTQLHEVGHTVGLRHNFGGSTDTMNYHDEYWEIQRAIAEGKIEPEDRWSVQGDVAKEIAGGEDVEYINEAEYRLSTVMDYTGDLTGRFGGLGKYDQAAINFAYGEVVEQWADDATLREEFGVQNGLGNYYDTELWLSDYTEIPRIMAGATGTGPATDPAVQLRGIDVVQNAREYVPIKQAIEQRRQGILTNTTNWQNGEFESSAKPYIDRTVPYEYCDDSYRGLQLNCDVYDWGSNQREIVNHQFNTYRLFQPFRRYNRGKIYRLYENLGQYQNWVYRIFQTAQNPFRYYSYFQWYDLGAYTDDLRDASIDAINFYAEVIATPQPGPYCLYSPQDTGVSPQWWYTLENTYVPAGWDRLDGMCANQIEVPKGIGQFYNYDFSDEYEYRIERVGSFVDKSVASLALFQISGNYVNSSFFTDFRATNVSYWTLFKDEMLNYLRGTFIGDYGGFAGVYDRQTQSYVSPRLVDAKSFGLGLESDQKDMKRIYTPMSFSHEFNFVVGGMLFNSGWYDRHTDFAQYLKLAVGTGEGQPFPEATELHEFVHPTTNQVYVAAQTNDGKSIAVDMVNWANQLKIRLADAKDNLEAQDPGTPDYYDANELYQFRSEQLEDVVAKMDMVRFVWGALGPDALR